MELDLQSLVGLLSTAVLIGWHPTTPTSPRIWAHIRVRYWSAKIDDINFGHLTPYLTYGLGSQTVYYHHTVVAALPTEKIYAVLYDPLISQSFAKLYFRVFDVRASTSSLIRHKVHATLQTAQSSECEAALATWIPTPSDTVARQRYLWRNIA